MRLWQFAVATGMFCVGLAFGDIAGVRNGYRAPLLTIPYAVSKPKIDGVVDDREWQGAFSINALQTTEAKISARQTRFWLMWDEDDIYVAMRSPLRAGERVVQAFRQTDRDNSSVVFDDSYEIWLNANTTSPDGQRVFFQYLGNFAGARYDVMFEPAVGNSRPGWTSGWKPVNRITTLPDGSKAWEMEVAIPRESIYRHTPFADGDELKGLIVRNFKRPWEQNSIGGSGSFSAGDTHARLLLSRRAPAIHLDAVADTEAGTMGFRLSGTARESETLRYTYQSDGGTDTAGEAAFSPGVLNVVAPRLSLDRPGKGDYRIRITSADGKTMYLDWCSRRNFGDWAALAGKVDDKGDQMALSLVFNPVSNFVRVDGDLINYDRRDEIKRYVARVADFAGKTLIAKELALDSLSYVRGVLPLSGCPSGEYTAILECLDASAKPIAQKTATFIKKDAATFPWWNTKAGDITKVIAPWTPVRYSVGRIDVWGRSMAVGPAGLPGGVSSQGQELSGSSMLVAELADGTVASASVPAVGAAKSSDCGAMLEAQSSLGTLDVTSQVTCEFDGMYKVQMRLSPRQAMTVRTEGHPHFE